MGFTIRTYSYEFTETGETEIAENFDLFVIETKKEKKRDKKVKKFFALLTQAQHDTE